MGTATADRVGPLIRHLAMAAVLGVGGLAAGEGELVRGKFTCPNCGRVFESESISGHAELSVTAETCWRETVPFSHRRRLHSCPGCRYTALEGGFRGGRDVPAAAAMESVRKALADVKAPPATMLEKVALARRCSEAAGAGPERMLDVCLLGAWFADEVDSRETARAYRAKAQGAAEAVLARGKFAAATDLWKMRELQATLVDEQGKDAEAGRLWEAMGKELAEPVARANRRLEEWEQRLNELEKAGKNSMDDPQYVELAGKGEAAAREVKALEGIEENARERRALCRQRQLGAAAGAKAALAGDTMGKLAYLQLYGADPAPGSVAILVAAAGEKNQWVRWEAARQLGEVGAVTPEVVPALRRLLKGDDLSAAVTAALALGKIGPKAAPAADDLIALFQNDGLAKDAPYVAWALGRIGPGAKAAVPALVKALGHEDSDVRAAAARALGFMGPEARQAIPALVDALADNRYGPGLPQAAAASLLRIDPANPDVVAGLIKCQLHRGPLPAPLNPALARHWTAAIPALVAALKNARTFEDSIAIHLLGHMGPTALPAVPALADLARKDAVFAYSVAEAMEQIGPGCLSELVRLLNCPDLDARIRACEALAHWGPAAAKALPALTAMVATPPGRASLAAAAAIATIDEAYARRHAATLRPLVAFGLAASDFRLRLPAAFVQARLGEIDKALPVLTQAVGRPEDHAILAAGYIARLGPAARAAAPALLDLLTRDVAGPTLRFSDRTTVMAAVAAIGVDPKAAVPVLIHHMEIAPTPEAARALGSFGPAAAEAAATLASMQNFAADQRIVAEAVDAIARIGVRSRTAMKGLAGMLDDTRIEPALQVRASRALLKLDGSSAAAMSFLLRLTESPDPGLRLLATQALLESARPAPAPRP